jgi:hypothetical protein
VTYNSQIEKNIIKLNTEYENIIQNVLFATTVHAALMPGRKYDVIYQNGDCSRDSNVHTLRVLYQNATSLQSFCGVYCKGTRLWAGIGESWFDSYLGLRFVSYRQSTDTGAQLTFSQIDIGVFLRE